VSCIAALAIVLASGVIYLLDSPRGDERRELFQRVLSSLLDEHGAAPKHDEAPERAAAREHGKASAHGAARAPRAP
jgi:hypothetical protein